LRDSESGSIIVVVATDAPLSALSLRHVARRAALGMGRGGTPGGNGSGDLFLAFSTVNRREMQELSGPMESFEFLNGEYLNPLYFGAVEAVEEAVINAYGRSRGYDDAQSRWEGLPGHRYRGVGRGDAPAWAVADHLRGTPMVAVGLTVMIGRAREH
jgi:L-aminopeptidase/D-esterase-like protein